MKQDGSEARAASADDAGLKGLGVRYGQRVGIRRGLLAAGANPHTLVSSVVHEAGDEDEDEGDQYPEPETHAVSFVKGRRDASIGVPWRGEWRTGSHPDEPNMVPSKQMY